MAKKLTIPLDKLKKDSGPKKKLVTFWIEEKLYDAFNSLCEKELDEKSVSQVIRKMIKELCIQNDYWKD